MRRASYDTVSASLCLLLMGLEFTLIARWYYTAVGKDPIGEFWNVLPLSVAVFVVVAVIAYFSARAVHKQRGPIALPEVKGYLNYLKVSRIWVFFLLIGVLLPIGLYLLAQMALGTSGGYGRRDPRRVMQVTLGMGPPFLILGCVGLIYAFIKGLFSRH
jgi:hypothetical protein